MALIYQQMVAFDPYSVPLVKKTVGFTICFMLVKEM